MCRLKLGIHVELWRTGALCMVGDLLVYCWVALKGEILCFGVSTHIV